MFSTSNGKRDQRVHTDVLILGTGLAGLLLALKLSENPDVSVVLASKGKLIESNSTQAQGGLAAVTDANAFDSPDLHLVDTLKSGAGLTDPEAARSIIFSGGRLIEELGKYGVSFDRGENGTFELALEGGHSQSRVLHNKDATGRAITTALAERISERAAACDADNELSPSSASMKAQSHGKKNTVKVFENAYAVDLIVGDGRCLGAQIEIDGKIIEVIAPHTVLATGGIGQIYRRTTNPSVATGDGIAMAYRAGARLTDMEFVQFHPTALCLDGAPPFLISEAVRGAGAVLLDHNDKRFVKRFHQDGELATRDIVARAIHTVMQENELQSVKLDLRPIGAEKIAKKFPTILSRCAEYGIDILREPIPIAPAAHYFMGGIQTDLNGYTSIRGLYAIGECASTGLHGANRLASNSLLEAGVMALRLADLLPGASQHRITRDDIQAQRKFAAPEETNKSKEQVLRFRTLMYSHAGLVRTQAGLTILLSELGSAANTSLGSIDTKYLNMLTVGRIVAQAALLREETRGGHFREDFPTLDNESFAKRLWLSKTGFGWVPQATQESKSDRQAAIVA